MASKVSVDEAQAHLRELIEKLAPGEEVVIAEGQEPVAKLVGERSRKAQRLPPGFYKGELIILEDDDEHLRDFTEYMS